ncbi:MAG: PAS domain S-box protein [Desulfomonile tiedjei]|uniref:histidine kinase n=1 Tax=Desulfomonile tiedjei TaxID=2358 RepID=A0A9D6UXX5_9BACT|nr:PAS domain S-box protein [Desulfomonile tiedjei]
MHEIKGLKERILELENLLESADRKADILTNLLKEANAEFERTLELVSRTESNFRAVFENAPEAIYIIDTDTRQIIDCNPFMEAWLGYNREELLSMKMDDLIVAEPSDVQNNIKMALDRGLVRVQERRYIKRDDTVVDAEVTGTVVEYGGKRCLAILVRDVTERKQLEELSRYKELFDNVSDPVFINDFQGRFLEVNEGACQLFNYSREQLLTMRVKELVRPNQLRILSESGKRIKTGETVAFELELLTKKGEPIPFEFHARPIIFKRKRAALSVARDLSFRKQFEEALIRTERLTAVGEMASGIAHNFNNLLQMVMGAGQAAMAKLKSGKTGQCSDAIGAILNSCERGADIVRRIKEFTDIGSEEVAQARNFDLSELVQEAVELTKPLWKDLPTFQKYKINLIDTRRFFVKGKPSEIYEVLVNLIKNALEAMPKGGRLTICTRAEKGKVYLMVSDTGQGIPEGNQQRIFEPFFTTKGLKSSGLGLSSSYGIVKKHGGEISVESTAGKGTTFTVILPKAKALAKKIGTSRKREVSKGPRIKFLVIDDEPNILKAVTMYFEDSEIEIVTARSGREGVKVFQEGGIDVVLCDLGMDDINGWDVGEHIKGYCESKGIPKPPFLIYTGWDTKPEPEELSQKGVDRVVTKPVPYDQLLHIIQEVTSKKKPPRTKAVRS